MNGYAAGEILGRWVSSFAENVRTAFDPEAATLDRVIAGGLVALELLPLISKAKFLIVRRGAAPSSSLASSTTTSQINPRLLQRLEAFRSYQANGGTMDMRRWVQATQGNPAYGTGFNSGYADWIRNVERGSVHPNSLLATGPHDVYVIRDAATGQLLHFGETGRGYLVRFAEHQRDFARLGIDIEVELLRTVDGKAAARLLETRYIDTFQRIFGTRPPFNMSNH